MVCRRSIRHSPTPLTLTLTEIPLRGHATHDTHPIPQHAKGDKQPRQRHAPRLTSPLSTGHTHGSFPAASPGGETESRLGGPGRCLARVGGHRGRRPQYPGSAQGPGGSTGDRGQALGGKSCLDLGCCEWMSARRSRTSIYKDHFSLGGRG